MPKSFLLSSTGQTDMIGYLGQSAAIKLMQVSIVVGRWVTVDFDSQYKIVWAETKVRGYRYLFE